MHWVFAMRKKQKKIEITWKDFFPFPKKDNENTETPVDSNNKYYKLAFDLGESANQKSFIKFAEYYNGILTYKML